MDVYGYSWLGNWPAPFGYSYWHNPKQLGWANAVFVDSHVRYLRATYRFRDFQHGPGWTSVYNDDGL